MITKKLVLAFTLLIANNAFALTRISDNDLILDALRKGFTLKTQVTKKPTSNQIEYGSTVRILLRNPYSTYKPVIESGVTFDLRNVKISDRAVSADTMCSSYEVDSFNPAFKMVIGSTMTTIRDLRNTTDGQIDFYYED